MSGLEEEATSDLERDPSENPYVWGPRAAYRSDLLGLSAHIKNLEAAIYETETKLDKALRPLEERIDKLTKQEHHLLGSLQQASYMAISLRNSLRNARTGAHIYTIRGQLETIQSSTRLDVEDIDEGVEGVEGVINRAKLMAADTAERLKPSGNLAIHLDAFGEQYHFVGQAFVSWAACLNDDESNNVCQWLDGMIGEQKEALEWRQEDRKRRQEKKEWEDEQLLTKLWPVS